MVVIIVVGIVFAAGVLVGMGAMVCLGIAREEHHRSFHDDPPGPAASATRVVVGFHARPAPGNNRGNTWPDRVNGVDGSWPPAA